MLQKLLLEDEEATGEFIGNKIADKITSTGKTKSKEKKMKQIKQKKFTYQKKTANYR